MGELLDGQGLHDGKDDGGSFPTKQHEPSKSLTWRRMGSSPSSRAERDRELSSGREHGTRVRMDGDRRLEPGGASIKVGSMEGQVIMCLETIDTGRRRLAVCRVDGHLQCHLDMARKMQPLSPSFWIPVPARRDFQWHTPQTSISESCDVDMRFVLLCWISLVWHCSFPQAPTPHLSRRISQAPQIKFKQDPGHVLRIRDRRPGVPAWLISNTMNWGNELGSLSKGIRHDLVHVGEAGEVGRLHRTSPNAGSGSTPGGSAVAGYWSLEGF
ncbi:hypothetical protein QBC40DRAFT_301106 [Triangularia verruculosa]|uniref:Uncharacterized protein n=1 Tax=Triangularia verruculosa TaxID=2587418 RepID=A0AAN6X8C8_9PEZI|nr:hypothetical protein QBC40DRAFT_301106 [Triangularia verruculosa]